MDGWMGGWLYVCMILKSKHTCEELVNAQEIIDK